MEGLDNCGKTTQIRKLLKYFIDKPTFVIHFSGIQDISAQKSKNYSIKLYNEMFLLMKNAYQDQRSLIFDRSHIGEYVYAPMYRNYPGDFIFDIENIYENDLFFNNIYLFTMIDDPENIIKREDGKSFSIELENKQKEIDLFVEATNRSNIKHKKIINIAGKSIDDVHKQVLRALDEE
jgi:thymidylate kinase